jgi:uncharacterized Zn-binding protein involved in type VI secretion
MPPAARQGDKVLQDGPHCHAPIHPPAPTPTPTPHPPTPWGIVTACIPTVMIEGAAAAVVGSITEPCKLATCVPNGPGVISKGSATVFHANLPAARVGDMTAHAGCVAPIPGPTGKVMPPGATKVIIGG